jgi:hypothetical protein
MGEAVFALPLIRAYKEHQSPIAYNYDTATGGSKKIYLQLAKHEFKTALDFKSFDKTVPPWLIRIAFDILKANIDFSNYQDYGVANASRMYKMLDYLANYFINTTIRTCDGARYRKHSGIASGSYFTQLIGSIVNFILVTWAFLDQHGSSPEFIKVFGDDSVCGSKQWLDLDKVSDLFNTIGMTVNVKKSMVTRNTTHITFLGFKINTGFPTKTSREWFSALMFPERPDMTWDDTATRALGLLHACAGLDYKFDLVCRAICKVSEYEIRWSKSMRKFMAIYGINLAKVDKHLPTHLDLALRTRVL